MRITTECLMENYKMDAEKAVLVSLYKWKVKNKCILRALPKTQYHITNKLLIKIKFSRIISKVNCRTTLTENKKI